MTNERLDEIAARVNADTPFDEETGGLHGSDLVLGLVESAHNYAAALATLPINPSDEALIDAFMAERARAGKICKLGTKKKR